MSIFVSRFVCPIFFAALSLVLPNVATAQDAPDAPVALSLDDAAALAVQRQPQLDALDAEARSARQRAIAAGELPDPRLSFGISDLTLEGSERFTLREESDTQIMAGVRQDFPRAGKRRLKRERAEHEAETFDAERLVRTASNLLRQRQHECPAAPWELTASLRRNDQFLVMVGGVNRGRLPRVAAAR